MDSPLNVGDTTTNSIQHLLSDTHLGTSCSSTIYSAIYSGEKVIQLNISILGGEDEKKEEEGGELIVILRRVQDSYVNVTQLFSILIRIGHFSETQLDNFFKNEILTNTQYLASGGSSPQYNDLRKHPIHHLRGLWIPYDRAVSLALNFDIYELAKKLFLVDVHDFEALPKLGLSNKRMLEHDSGDDQNNAGLMGSPAKRQKSEKQDDEEAVSKTLIHKAAQENTNFPYTLPPLELDNESTELISEIKLKFGDLFKKDDTSDLTFNEIKQTFKTILQSKRDDVSSLTDIPLDQQGKSALHFASTLASLNLVSAFINLGLCSPVRGTSLGKSPLISTILVTNSMEKGNFIELLDNWLWPNLWLYDSKKWSVLHYLVSQSTKNFESSKFYLNKILEWIISNESAKQQNSLANFSKSLVNLQDEENDNTCLHLAAENESKWFINIFLELKADVNIANKMGVKPVDYDIVKDIMTDREHGKDIHGATDQDNYIIELVRTGMEFLDKRVELGVQSESDIDEDFEINSTKEENTKITPISTNGSSSNKIFQSIQDLLANTNHEYENIVKSKKEQIKNLNNSLHDATIVTANNRFVTSKISEKLSYLDNLKLQMANITEKLQLTQKELPDDLKIEDEDENTKFNSDEPFIIKPIYEKLLKNEEIEETQPNKEIISTLPSLPILKARIKAYEEINSKIDNELTTLLDYSELTSKFKKVVSFCTGVDVNEVDELLDGLLEAVEGQQ